MIAYLQLYEQQLLLENLLNEFEAKESKYWKVWGYLYEVLFMRFQHCLAWDSNCGLMNWLACVGVSGEAWTKTYVVYFA